MLYEEERIEKQKCHNLVNKAIQNGILIRPKICSNCQKEGIKIEAHHPDYSKPLEVIWLCKSCHKKEFIPLTTSHYTELPKVTDNMDEEVCPTKMDLIYLKSYKNCTYTVLERFDPLRAKNKITIKFYDYRGYVVYKEEYYKT